MKPVFIYTLNDPTTGIVRYCGQTIDPDIRLRKHITHSKKRTYHCARWVRDLLSKSLRPVMEILDVVPDDEADFWEREYIQNFRERGFDLTNLTDGGEGGATTTGRKHSLDTIEKIRASNLGKNTGKKHSAETRENYSITRKGHVPWNRGIKMSPAACKNMSDAQKRINAKRKENI